MKTKIRQELNHAGLKIMSPLNSKIYSNIILIEKNMNNRLRVWQLKLNFLAAYKTIVLIMAVM